MTVSKVYSGKIVKGRKQVKVREASVSTPLLCLDFFTPSFAWGYHGGAADELAIAILHDHLGSSGTVFQERVLGLYRAFVEDVVSKFTHDGPWSIGAGSIARWVGAQDKAAAALAARGARVASVPLLTTARNGFAPIA